MEVTALVALLAALAFLAWSADRFVASALEIGRILHLPKMVVGIVLVGFATSAPELAVSVQSSYLGHPEIALGNALGSVLANDGLAIALAVILSASPILIDRSVFMRAAPFILSIDVLAYVLARDGRITRYEGGVLIALLIAYFAFVLGRTMMLLGGQDPRDSRAGLTRCVLWFSMGLAGIIAASRVIIWSAGNLAASLGISEAIVGLTMIAVGTSLPEIATCISAARRRESNVVVGNIVGSDVFNILWVIGMSAAVTPITVSTKIINFAFPWMLAIVVTMLISMRTGYRLTRPKGVLLLAMYTAYIVTAVKWFY
ncbi:MAG: calcium/sodium antiporter [Candidatus Eisenbacteria sp.]|nr:calcium/sodium antiporter [Candidatus Eisenbacteria bacterium]